jgi:hypothetical protein
MRFVRLKNARFNQTATLARGISLKWLAACVLMLAIGKGYAAFSLSILDTGAVPDGTTDNTQAIQKAIDACHDHSGGEVIIPGGRFLTGTLQLRDNVTLRFQTDSVLLGIPQLNAYRNLDPFKDGLGIDVGYALITAIDAKNIGLEGDGTIDGQGRMLANTQIRSGDKNWGKRPFLMQLVRCSGVTVRGLHLQNSAAWTFHLFQCSDVTVEKLGINSHGLPHNDGIDIDSCRNVRVKDCDIVSGDDALCFKTTSIVPCQDVQISGCTVSTGESAIKMGTESLGNFENIQISNCRVRVASEGGIKLISVDGSHLQNVTISNIEMADTTLPVMIRLGSRLKTFRPGDPKPEVGTIKNVTLRNITARSSSLIGVLITGIPGHPIENLTLSHLELNLPGGGSWEEGQETLEEKESAYPEISMFGNRMPSCGVYVRHVRGLGIDHLTLNLANPDLRPALLCLDGQDLHFSHWTTNGKLEADVPVRLESVQHALFSQFDLHTDEAVFVSVSGKDSSGIRLEKNQLGPTALPSQIADDVDKSAVESL